MLRLYLHYTLTINNIRQQMQDLDRDGYWILIFNFVIESANSMRIGR